MWMCSRHASAHALGSLTSDALDSGRAARPVGSGSANLGKLSAAEDADTAEGSADTNMSQVISNNVKDGSAQQPTQTGSAPASHDDAKVGPLWLVASSSVAVSEKATATY